MLDLGADFRVFEDLRISARVRNLLDDTYVVARRPAGLRPGLPRTFEISLHLAF